MRYRSENCECDSIMVILTNKEIGFSSCEKKKKKMYALVQGPFYDCMASARWVANVFLNTLFVSNLQLRENKGK